MKKLLIFIYFTIMILTQFGFLSLIFYPEASLSIIKKLLLITVLVYTATKSNKYRFRITRDVSIMTLIFSIVVSLIY